MAQNGHVYFELDIDTPRTIEIPAKLLDDRSGLPQYLLVMRLGTKLGIAGDNGQCVRCVGGKPADVTVPAPELPCCQPPKFVGSP